MALTGTQIRDLRLERGISQKRAASILGVRSQTLGRWEQGAPISAGAAPRVRLGIGRLKSAAPDPHNPRDLRRAPEEWQTTLRERRERVGLSLPSMARRLNISRARLNDYETGHMRPSVAVMEAAERVLKQLDSQREVYAP